MHVLLVEDDPQLCEQLTQVLEQQGHSVFPCQDAGQSINALRTVTFGAVITDMQLPIGNGIDVLFEIWSGQYDIPSLLHSAEDYFQGDDLRKISLQFPFAVFRNKGGDIRAYIEVFLKNLPPVMGWW